MKSRIAILVDQKWRDLPGLVWLKLLLERIPGVEARLFPFGSEQAYMPLFRPHVAVFNNLLDRARVAFAKRLTRQGTRIVVLPTEGIPTLKWQLDDWAGAGADWSALDLYLPWNNVIRSRVLELGALPENKVRAIGIPRFDFHRSPVLRRCAMSRETYGAKFGLNLKCPTVLWPTNFTLAGFETRNTDLWRSIHKAMHWDTAYPDLKAEDLPRIDGDTRRSTRAALLALRRALPDVNLAIKPHPNEDVVFWRESIDEIRGIPGAGQAAIIEGVYIWDALSSADVIVQRSCTTAPEAWFFGIPSVEMRLNSCDFYYSEDHASGSEEAASAEALVGIVRGYLFDNRRIPDSCRRAQKAFEEKWCITVDGHRTEAAAREIASLLDQPPGAVSFPLPHPRFLSQLSKAAIKRMFGHRPHELLTWDYILRLRRKPAGTDILGRSDKYVNMADIAHWEETLRPLVSQIN